MTTATVCVFGWVVFVVTWSIGMALAFLDGEHPRRANGAPRWGNPGLEIIAGILSGVGALGAIVGLVSGAWWLALRVTR